VDYPPSKRLTVKLGVAQWLFSLIHRKTFIPSAAEFVQFIDQVWPFGAGL
jgi:hypothetical protein